MPRVAAAAALLVLMASGAARAQSYDALIKDCEHGNSDPDKAIRACPPLAEMQGAEPVERAFAYQNLAIAYQVKGDDGTAITYFDKALKYFPDMWEARVGRMQSDLMRDDIDAAATDFDLLSKMDTTLSDKVKLPLGIHYWSVKQHIDGDGTVKTLDDQTPQGSIARMQDRLVHALSARCASRATKRAYESALSDCNLAMHYAPEHIAARGWRGFIEFQTGQFPAALQDFDAVLAAKPHEVGTLYTRGVVKHRLGDVKGGDSDIQAALALDPNAGKKLASKGITP